MVVLRCLLVLAVLAGSHPTAVSAQLFRRGIRATTSRGYYEMGCDCSNCVANRGGTYAQVYGQAEESLDELESTFGLGGNPHASTPPEVIAVALRLADLKPHDLLYDCGSGDGRVIEAAVRYGCRAVGIEIDPGVAESARARLRAIHGLPNRWRITTGDALRYDLSQATVAYLNLYPDVLAKVVPKLTGATRIVSYIHPVPGCDNQKIETDAGPIYVVDRRPADESWSAFDESWSTTKTEPPTREPAIVQVARKECST